MAEVTMMNVFRIRAGKIEHFPKTDKRDHAFWTREVRITTEGGVTVTLRLYADSEEALYMLDKDSRCLEVPTEQQQCEGRVDGAQCAQSKGHSGGCTPF